MSIRSNGWALPVVLVVLVAAGARVWSQTATGGAAPIPRGVAVVNISSVFDHLDERVDSEKDMDKMNDDLNSEGHKLEKDVADLQDRLKLLKPDSPDFKAAQQTLLKKVMESSTFPEYQKQLIGSEQLVRTKAMYRRINDAVDAYAQANNIALVLVADDPNMSDARTPQELMLKIASRKVLYAHSEYDITQKLTLKMNADYMLHGK